MESTIHGNPYYHLFKWRRFDGTMSGSIGSGSRKGLLATDFSHTTASGDVIPYSMIQEIDGQEYIVIGIRGFYGGNGNLSFRQLNLLYPYMNDSDTYMSVVRNSSTSAQSNKIVRIDAVLMKKPSDVMIYEVVDGQFKKRVNNQDGTQSLVVIDNGE